MIPKHIHQMYKKEQLFHGVVCTRCKGASAEADFQHYRPLAIWHVGIEYSKANPRILFAGKPHRGEPYDEIISDKEYCVGFSEETAKDLFFNYNNWHYWNYTKEISARIFGDADAAWNSIAFSNVIKCSVDANEHQDYTPGFMKEACIEKLGIFWKELVLLEPTHVILYLGRYYDRHIENEVIQQYLNVSEIHEITNQEAVVQIGQKQCVWWDRIIQLKEGRKIKLLRIGHPERKKKEHYVGSVVDWLKS